MKTFYKISPDFQLGHLYEHIFLNQFVNSLRDVGFLAFLDYEIYGESYNDGVVKIYFNPFSDEVSDFFNDRFGGFRVKLSDSEVETAISQICCEKHWDFAGFPSTDETLHQLSRLNDKSWIEFDENNEPDESIKTESAYIIFTKKDRFNKYRFSISAPDKVDSQAFFLLSKIIINSASEDIEYKNGCFTQGVNEESTSLGYNSDVLFISNSKIEDFDVFIILDLIKTRIDDIVNMFLLAGIKITEDEISKIISLMEFSIAKIEK